MNILCYVLQDLEKQFLRSKVFLPSLYSVATINNARKKKFDVLSVKIFQDKYFNPNTALSLQVIGSGAVGAPRCLFVYTSNNNFLFNCGEGIRRIANEYKKPISTVSGIFITASSWDNVSGVPGIQEYIHHASKRNFNIYGPPGLAPLMNTFSSLNNELSHVEHVSIRNEKLDFEESLNVEAVPIFSSSQRESLKEKNHHYLSKKDREGGFVVAYICRPYSYAGVICINLMVRAGVPPGPLVQSLKEGCSVTLENGRVVHPREVTRNAFKGGSFIVLEIPSVEYLDTLSSCPAFHPFQDQKSPLSESSLEAIVHFSPPEVMRDPRYLSFVNSFSPSVSHIVINESNACLGLKESLVLQVKLHQFLPRVFPLLHDSSIPSFATKSENPNTKVSLDSIRLTDEYRFRGPTIQASTMLQYHIRPLNQFDGSNCPVLYPVKIVKSVFEEESVVTLFEEAKRQFSGLREREKREREKRHGQENQFPKFVFLGTGSACPNVVRNVAGILVSADDETEIMFDCGEGTFNQVVRLMGLRRTRQALRDLRLVFISHHHRDHYLGLPSLLIERQKAFREANLEIEPLYILSTTTVSQYLNNIHQCFAPILKNASLINNVNLVQPGKFFDQQKHDKVCEALRLKRVDLAFVLHVKNSFGISVSHQDGWKVTYSGDTMPCQELVKIGMNSDVLIHEASFEDTMEEEAEMKRHSTVGQAIQVGAQMNAKFTILTHFSQRYYHIPVMDGGCPANVGFAFDNMTVETSDLPYLPHLYPILKELFYQNLEKLKGQQHRRTISIK